MGDEALVVIQLAFTARRYCAGFTQLCARLITQ
jgi:hypothetical protein